ncbi:hypothetical protein ACHAXA_002248 [Cyclostephanos tholiformis]|uniref:Dockerin domain-containing protein n=1 Tax=Cyclostephanos tholiformis TaxID=382380 RepID=A0ABD3R8B7_9STRA
MKINLLSSFAAASASILFPQSVSGQEESTSHLLRGSSSGQQQVQEVHQVRQVEGQVERSTQAQGATSSAKNGVIIDPATNAVIDDWSKALIAAIRKYSTPPPKASRAMAMVHLAIFEALNGIDEKYDRYHVTGVPAAGASSVAAAATAAHGVLSSLFPTEVATFDALLTSSVAPVPSSPLASGSAWGRACANDVLSLRLNDNSDLIVGYTSPGGTPGLWEPTFPNYAPALLPSWPQVLPFAMGGASELRPQGPPSLTSQEYAIAYDEVKNVGNKTSAIRTADMSQIAIFWADGAGTETPPGHWLRIASEVSTARGMPPLERARLLALVGLGVADAAIVSWDAKYAYHHWRPITAIRAGSADTNDATVEDPNFLPLIGTPPFPGYTSGHSTFSAASARILGRVFGDSVSFSTNSNVMTNVARSFASFSAAAAEAGQSRIYGGIHFQYDNRDGLSSGKALGDIVVDGFLRLIGDLNNDGCVDDADLAILASQIGQTNSRADLNKDGIVDNKDRVIFKNYLSSSCTTASASTGGGDPEQGQDDQDQDNQGQDNDFFS